MSKINVAVEITVQEIPPIHNAFTHFFKSDSPLFNTGIASG
jgi:hypothetical protein